MKEFHYRWEFDLRASPQALWPLVADTNRFNRDAGVPEVAALLEDPAGGLAAEPSRAQLKGFDDESFELWRVMRKGDD